MYHRHIIKVAQEIQLLNQEVRTFVISDDELPLKRELRNFRFKMFTLFGVPHKSVSNFIRDHFHQVHVYHYKLGW